MLKSETKTHHLETIFIEILNVFLSESVIEVFRVFVSQNFFNARHRILVR